jgi:hypothetical protein
LAEVSIGNLLELIEAGRAAEEELEGRISNAAPLSKLSYAARPSDEEIAWVVDALSLCVEGEKGEYANGRA